MVTITSIFLLITRFIWAHPISIKNNRLNLYLTDKDCLELALF
jgi:hypothetical protein